MQEIDCRGMACPLPVVTTKQALDRLEGDGLRVIIDNPLSRDNVQRLAVSQGFSVAVEPKGEDFYLQIRKGDLKGKERILPSGKSQKVVVYINSNLLGEGEEALGSFLMKSFLKTLLDLEKKPDRLILINSGVKLASEGSRFIDTLVALADKGVEIVACGTCLDFYGLKGKMKVGTVSNMYDIIQSMQEADHLIRP